MCVSWCAHAGQRKGSSTMWDQGIDLGSSGLAVNAFCSPSLITGPVSSSMDVCLVSYLFTMGSYLHEGRARPACLFVAVFLILSTVSLANATFLMSLQKEWKVVNHSNTFHFLRGRGLYGTPTGDMAPWVFTFTFLGPGCVPSILQSPTCKFQTILSAYKANFSLTREAIPSPPVLLSSLLIAPFPANPHTHQT